jgi:hypothetical protein
MLTLPSQESGKDLLERKSEAGIQTAKKEGAKARRRMNIAMPRIQSLGSFSAVWLAKQKRI